MVRKIDKIPQLIFFETPLINFINTKHELVIIVNKIDWEDVEKYFEKYYSQSGRPSVPIRTIPVANVITESSGGV